MCINGELLIPYKKLISLSISNWCSGGLGKVRGNALEQEIESGCSGDVLVYIVLMVIRIIHYCRYKLPHN